MQQAGWPAERGRGVQAGRRWVLATSILVARCRIALPHSANLPLHPLWAHPPTHTHAPALQCNATGDLGWLCSSCSGDEPEFCTDCQGGTKYELGYGAFANELGQCVQVCAWRAQLAQPAAQVRERSGL